MMKGLEMPTNIIVGIIIAALVLVVLLAYFLTSTGTTMTDAQSNAAFSNGCLRYCKSDVETNYISAYQLSQSDTEFIQACEKLGYGSREFPNRCLEKCGKFCDMKATSTDISNRHDQVISSLK